MVAKRLGTRGIALHRDTGKLKKTVWDVYVAGTSGAAIHIYRDTAASTLEYVFIEEDNVAGCCNWNMGVALHRRTTEEDSVGCLCIWERGEFALYGGTAEESSV